MKHTDEREYFLRFIESDMFIHFFNARIFNFLQLRSRTKNILHFE